jgi:hypothetical protein
MGEQSITMYRGDTNTITVTVTDSEGSVFDLTDYTMRFTVKDKSSDSDDLAKIGPKTATISTPLTGVGVIAIDEDDSNLKAKSYVYDVQITSTANNYTIIKDDFIILEDVTRETS